MRSLLRSPPQLERKVSAGNNSFSRNGTYTEATRSKPGRMKRSIGVGHEGLGARSGSVASPQNDIPSSTPNLKNSCGVSKPTLKRATTAPHAPSRSLSRTRGTPKVSANFGYGIPDIEFGYENRMKKAEAAAQQERGRSPGPKNDSGQRNRLGKRATSLTRKASRSGFGNDKDSRGLMPTLCLP
jgi:hypothetical protein